MVSTSYAWASGALFVSFFLLLIFINMAIYNSEIICPDAESISDNLVGQGTNILTQVTTIMGTFFSPCSGLDWWVYLLVFVPMGFGLVAFLNPFTG